MLVLKYDAKCGFSTVYVVERNIIFPVSELLSAIRPETWKTDEAILLEQYKFCPQRFLDDYDLVKTIYTSTKIDFAKLYFKHLCLENELGPVMPDICEIYNIRIEMEADKQEKDTAPEQKVAVIDDDSNNIIS